MRTIEAKLTVGQYVSAINPLRREEKRREEKKRESVSSTESRASEKDSVS